ncbi:D-glycero-beta-D-manno-heptose 1,7-bisphosphate 7-phosphatase [bacterium]|nr:D-glycero-beta-D-manno-heptose 1,7-bisphosphate 7-phosphatase [bacterium]
MKKPPAVIMAGGKGTRIAAINATVPKPMIEIADKPILQYELEVLSRQGYRDVTIVTGHLGHAIQEYFGDGSSFDLQINYLHEKEPLGTAGALYWLKGKVSTDFLLLNADIIFDVDLDRFYRYHQAQKTTATILTHPNAHPYDSAIIAADKNNIATAWLHKEDTRLWYRNRVNAGLHFLSPSVFASYKTLEKKDLDRDILKPLIETHQLSVYDSPEYVKDMGTPDRYENVIKDLRDGLVAARNLNRRQKAIFLDRDGTLNKDAGFLTNIDQLELIPGASEAVKLINDSGYLAIVVTNQPAIARGELTIAQLDLIHQKLETLLGQDGAYLDAIYYCPHHPDKGFSGERPEYKIECECRKPKPGMLLQAARHFNIDLSSSWMIGDSIKDIEAGKAVNCYTALLSKEQANIQPDLSARDLLSAVKKILDK